MCKIKWFNDRIKVEPSNYSNPSKSNYEGFKFFESVQNISFSYYFSCFLDSVSLERNFDERLYYTTIAMVNKYWWLSFKLVN